MWSRSTRGEGFFIGDLDQRGCSEDGGHVRVVSLCRGVRQLGLIVVALKVFILASGVLSVSSHPIVPAVAEQQATVRSGEPPTHEWR